jgi:hypothetical protein
MNICVSIQNRHTYLHTRTSSALLGGGGGVGLWVVPPLEQLQGLAGVFDKAAQEGEGRLLVLLLCATPVLGLSAHEAGGRRKAGQDGYIITTIRRYGYK